MDITRISHAFEMSGEEFSKLIGYKRGSLYAGIHMTSKAMRAIDKLRVYSEAKLERDILEAQARHKLRESAINEFITMILPSRGKGNG